MLYQICLVVQWEILKTLRQASCHQTGLHGIRRD